MTQKADFLILGAGIIGLAIATELRRRHPDAEITVIEKESEAGRHGSGRNSGVLHSGIYYPEDSMKAKMCAEGARMMREFCELHGLPIKRIGKVILPTRADEQPQLDLLLRRAAANGAEAALVDRQQLQEIEPDAHSATGSALHVPGTAVVNPKRILGELIAQLTSSNVRFCFDSTIRSIDPQQSAVTTKSETFAYRFLFNATGQHADKVAKRFGAGERYAMLPFKGLYYRLRPDSTVRCNGLIYPVPDLNMPFLGVHFTKSVDGEVHLGPTAVPAFGRENYRGLQGLDLYESVAILYRLARQYALDKQNFRHFSHTEALRFFKAKFVEAARALVPALKSSDLLPSDKVGIRAQLLDTVSSELVTDFVVERKENTVHVLNAISPAFTSSLSFARYIADQQEG